MKTYQFADIQARPFPNCMELRHPHIYRRTGIVINVSERDYPTEYKQYLLQQGKQFHGTPSPAFTEFAKLLWMYDYHPSREQIQKELVRMVEAKNKDEIGF